ncbi:uncharacterized protein BO97DRAFT_273756 [Aspergillus homomorphus CBS 101889]|uniref:Rho-GAP domain-containing protein n=1 Tax=Aspergillus homomorphus (strain CBS 101889) TaxID=1450537 RepID=A0A395I5Y4_ASPHC|nr:hypothetical protein BO97DRAFT_273756 [Aspergillus homomorphus CBS 101889]RAL14598.1 hypothetical protein BO97DRAFT_273756 [Aspergillus homomorphus CBS 101889]
MGALEISPVNRDRRSEPVKHTSTVVKTKLSSETATITTDGSNRDQTQPLIRRQLSPVAPTVFPKYTRRSFRRLTGFKTLFRFRKSRQPDLSLNALVELTTGPENTSGTVERCCAGFAPIPQCSSQSTEAGEARKVSDTTMYSLHSDQTSGTVYHDPSKRLSMPIALADPTLCQNPFADPLNEVGDSDGGGNHTRNTTRTTRQSSSESSQTGASSTYDDTESYQQLANPFAAASSIGSGSSSRDSVYFSTSDDSSVIAEVERRAAVLAFNELAYKLRLPPLPLSNKGGMSGDGLHSQFSEQPLPTTANEKVPSGRRDRLYGRLRTMRSTLHLGLSSEGPRTSRTLRRMKTLAHVGGRANDMTSLMGLSLEELARLGGYNLLTLPAEFAPTKLRLPVCFVATITALGRFAAPVRDVFVDPGHPKMAMRIYDHFAHLVLSALRQPDRIQMTVGRSDLPLTAIEPGARAMDDPMVQSIARAFQALLAGLPGGLLGLPALYRILVSISQAPLVDDGVEWPRSCLLRGASLRNYVKVKAIGLALLALTNTMQLHLICGVIGLSAILLHETQRLAQEEAPSSGPGESGGRTSGGSGLLTLDRLGRVLGPLLTGREGYGDTFGAIAQEIESERVAMMLVEHWRGISRQLRIWEHRNLPRRRRRSVQMGRAMISTTEG